MALITCPDCGTEVSDRASSCVRCGAPIGPHGPVTIQATSKAWKLTQAVGVVGMLLGTASCVGAMGQWWALWSVGALTFVAGRVGAWWDHA